MSIDEARLPWRNVRGYATASPRPRIVVVDDLEANVVLLQRLLATADLDVEVVGFTDPVAGLDHCRHDPPSLILLDLHMPQLDGIEFLRTLERYLPTPWVVPVLVLSADVTPESRSLALSAGARDFVAKPFDRTEVLLRVANLLEIQAFYVRLTETNERLEAELSTRLEVERLAEAATRSTHAEIDLALSPGGLSVVFQPVTEVASGRVVGVEALSRFPAGPARPPDRWFAAAESVGRGVELEMAALARALGRIDDLPEDAFMAINLSPATILDPAVHELLRGFPATRVVIELTEHTHIDDYEPLLDAMAPLRATGVRFAVDDTGAGYAGFESLLRLQPDILKLDTSLTRGVDADPIRWSLAAALVTFADQIGADLIAEGIESPDELDALRTIGIPWGQGYLLGAPGELPLPSGQVPGYAGVEARHNPTAV